MKSIRPERGGERRTDQGDAGGIHRLHDGPAQAPGDRVDPLGNRPTDSPDGASVPLSPAVTQPGYRRQSNPDNPDNI